MLDATSQTDDPFEILLVEDNPGDVRLTREAFATSDRETSIDAIRHGDDAIDHLTERVADGPEPAPDLVLLDLNLPGTDGPEVLEAIRDHPRLAPLPVVVLSSSADRTDVERCYGARANAYLTKPDGPDEFASLAKSVERFWFDRAKLPPVAP